MVAPISGTFADANAGAGKAVTVSGLTLTGGAASNYSIVSSNVSVGLGDIDAKTLTATFTGALEKTYDGTTSASLTSGDYSLSSVVGGDSVGPVAQTSGTYGDANAGTAKTVTVSGRSLTCAGGHLALTSGGSGQNTGAPYPDKQWVSADIRFSKSATR